MIKASDPLESWIVEKQQAYLFVSTKLCKIFIALFSKYVLVIQLKLNRQQYAIVTELNVRSLKKFIFLQYFILLYIIFTGKS